VAAHALFDLPPVEPLAEPSAEDDDADEDRGRKTGPT
jgi:hypothetical protein